MDKLTALATQGDPEDARRGKNLDVLMIGLGATLIAVFCISLLFFSSVTKDRTGVTQTVWVSGFMFLGLGLVYVIRRFWSEKIAAVLFLTFLMIAISFADTPEQLVNGRSLFVYVIPIAMSGLVLRPVYSFLFAAIGGAIITIIALGLGNYPNIPGIAGFFLVALVSWLSARSLEKRVEERTRELSESLTREAEQASQRQAILQGIADGVVVFDTTGNAILSNPALSRLVDVPFDQIVSRKARDIFGLSDAMTSEELDLLLQVLDTNAEHMPPARIHWGRKTLSVAAAPVRNTKNVTIGNVAVFRDFTREAEVEEMKNSFVAMVSHELRTPLNAILGYSEMAASGYYGPMNDKQTGVLERIFQNSRRLLDIVSDLLDKAQIEAGHLRLEPVVFRTADLEENVHSVMDKIAGDRGLYLNSEIEATMPDELWGDPKRIQQVLVNLVNNAVKFTDAGGISVKVYRVADGFWAFDVTDTGPGISAEDQKYIFDPFRQVDKTVTRSHGGIGLGLSIVKRLVDLMDGRIFLKSIVGQGSTFTVIFPLIQPERKN